MEEKAKPDTGDITTGGSLMHSDQPKPDFSGYVTKANLKCSDGRTILPDAFKHQDKMTVPLVWQHNHDEPENVLGHTVLENRDDGVYGYAYFNKTKTASHAKELVDHKDIRFLSIFANQLKEQAQKVVHGVIREVSLVMAGANPGALIDNISLQHSDGSIVELDDEAVITTGLELEHEDKGSESLSQSADDPTIQEVYDAMSEDEKNVVHYFAGQALVQGKQEGSGAAKHSDTDSNSNNENDDKEGTRRMTRNVFEQENEKKDGDDKHVLTHDAMKEIFADAAKRGSMKEAVEGYALQHGIENIDILFPDAKTLMNTPEFDARRVEWVSGVINGTRHLPFTRIKSVTADITQDEARARGYIKGNMKKEEWFGVSKRTTGPTTVYKKQQLDRDDILDITDFDVVAWLKAEMRLMLDEELARAILISDGRDVDDDDKIKDPVAASDGQGIRSIINEHELYAARVNINIDDASSNPGEVVDELIRNMRFYKGSGAPTMYISQQNLTYMLLHRDGQQRRMWRTASDLAAEIGVSNITVVEILDQEPDLFAIIVNLKDYAIGTDRGGEVNFFDDFDIDYNQYKYLLETRLSGALTKIRSALIVNKVAGTDALVVPESPDFDGTTITPATTAGITYKRADTNATVTTGAPIALSPGDSLKIYATPNAGKYFETDQEDEWTFTNDA
jgi:HK97 family phage prohead protease